MATTDDLVPVLRKLRLSGVLETLDLRVRQAAEDSLAYPEFLQRLLTDEVERRQAKQLGLALRRASFESSKTLEDFDFTFNTGVPKSKIIDLATCHFLSGHENILVIGHAGVGKSHIAQAIGLRACMSGHSAYYTSAKKMFKELRAARADESYDKKLLRYTSPALLIIDDLGLQPLKRDEPEDLYEVIQQRYERGSTIITSNRAIDEWYPLFGDQLLASAALDRLLHHAHVVVMEGESFRNPPKKRRAPTRKKAEKQTA